MARIVAVMGAALVIAAGLMFWNGRAPTSGEPLLSGMAIAQEAEIDVSTIAEMEQGNPDAPVTVIEYASFTCPHCARFHQTVYKQLKSDYIDTGKIRFVYREVYFDRFGLWASMIARCGGAEKFFGMAELMYDGQGTWARAGGPAEIVGELRKIGRLAGLTDATLDTCLQDGTKAQTLVAWYQQNAEEHGIDSTPSFIINGEKHSNMNFADMSKILNEALGE